VEFNVAYNMSLEVVKKDVSLFPFMFLVGDAIDVMKKLKKGMKYIQNI